MSEHAPSPWTIEPREVTALLLSKDGTHLANIFANDNSILQPQSKWANARLIAAAPEMADEITALRAENERLRAALWDIHAVCNNWDWFIWMWPIRRIKRIARAALEEK